MERPKVMTPMGPLHLPIWLKCPEGESGWSFADGEFEKWRTIFSGVMGAQVGSGAGNGAVAANLIGLLPTPPVPDTSGRVLTMAGVARLLGIPSPREARKFLHRNGLKPVKVGRKFFIQKATVEDFIIGQEKAPTPAAVYAKARTPAGDAAAAKLAAVDRLDAERKSGVQA